MMQIYGRNKNVDSLLVVDRRKFLGGLELLLKKKSSAPPKKNSHPPSYFWLDPAISTIIGNTLFFGCDALIRDLDRSSQAFIRTEDKVVNWLHSIPIYHYKNLTFLAVTITPNSIIALPPSNIQTSCVGKRQNTNLLIM